MEVKPQDPSSTCPCALHAVTFVIYVYIANGLMFLVIVLQHTWWRTCKC